MRYTLAIFVLFKIIAGENPKNTIAVTNGSPGLQILDDRIQTLHKIGQDFVSKKNYFRASEYYLAMLQLLEGVGGQKSQELRIKCLLSLSFCDFKTEQYYQVIARCSDIIDELPPGIVLVQEQNNCEDDSFVKFLGKSYYRRGLALYSLDLPYLAIPDLKMAHTLLPNETKITDKIGTILLEEADSITNSAISNDNSTTNNTNESHHSLIVNEDLQNILDYSRNVTYQQRPLGNVEIDRLVRPVAIRQNNAIIPNNSGLGGGGLSSLFNMGASDSGDGGGLSSLLKMGGVGIGNNVEDLTNKIEMFGPLIQQVTGVDSKTMKNVIEIGKAVVNVYKLFRYLLKQVIKNSGFLVAITWLVLCYVYK